MFDQIVNNFYSGIFIQNSNWNNRYPNVDEAVRAGKIIQFMAMVRRELQVTSEFIIIDVGCGRGWLTNILSVFGTVIGVEPVEDVVRYAIKLFPDLIFIHSSPAEYKSSENFQMADVVVCSEVIEHVPYEEQIKFLCDLANLLDSKGYLIITSPRGELFPEWKLSHASQPVENWLTEDELAEKLLKAGFSVIERDRCYPTKLGRARFQLFHNPFIRKLFSIIGYQDDFGSKSMIYQVILAKKID